MDQQKAIREAFKEAFKGIITQTNRFQKPEQKPDTGQGNMVVNLNREAVPQMKI